MAVALDFKKIIDGVGLKKKASKESLYILVERESMTPLSGIKDKGYSLKGVVLSAFSSSEIKKGDSVEVVVSGNSLEKMNVGLSKNKMTVRDKQPVTLFLEGVEISGKNESGFKLNSAYAKAALPQFNSEGQPNYSSLVITVADGEALDSSYRSQPTLSIEGRNKRKSHYHGIPNIARAIDNNEIIITDESKKKKKSEELVIRNIENISAFTNKIAASKSIKVDTSGTLLSGIVKAVKEIRSQGFNNSVMRIALGDQDGCTMFPVYPKTYGVKDEDIESSILALNTNGKEFSDVLAAIESVRDGNVHIEVIPSQVQNLMGTHQLPELIMVALNYSNASKIVRENKALIDSKPKDLPEEFAKAASFVSYYNSIQEKYFADAGVSFVIKPKDSPDGVFVLSSPVTLDQKSKAYGIESLPTLTLPKEVFKNVTLYRSEEAAIPKQASQAEESHEATHAASKEEHDHVETPSEVPEDVFGDLPENLFAGTEGEGLEDDVAPGMSQ